jgi:acyl carrier protein
VGGLHARMVNTMTKVDFVRKLEAELGLKDGTLTDTTPLSSVAAWDSMGRMAVLAMIDSELDFTLAPGVLQHCRTVADLVAAVSAKLHQA